VVEENNYHFSDGFYYKLSLLNLYYKVISFFTNIKFNILHSFF